MQGLQCSPRSEGHGREEAEGKTLTLDFIAMIHSEQMSLLHDEDCRFVLDVLRVSEGWVLLLNLLGL